MNSNENDAMRLNDVLSETNILICYMTKRELRLRRYKQSKIARKLGFRGREVNLDLDPAALFTGARLL